MADFDETTRHAVKAGPRPKAPEASDPDLAVGPVPEDMTVEQTLEWVAGDRRRAQAAIDAEESRKEPRTTLIGNLQRITTAQTGAGIASGEA
jgi:hypothetical protein